jgi:hypothetical protein
VYFGCFVLFGIIGLVYQFKIKKEMKENDELEEMYKKAE